MYYRSFVSLSVSSKIPVSCVPILTLQSITSLLVYKGTKSLDATLFVYSQLLRDFLSSNGTPFPEELGDVKKFRKVDTHANQAHVDTVNLESLPILTGALTNANMNPQNVEHEAGNGLEFDKTGDENIVHGRRGRKRLRRKVLSANHDIGDDEPEEMQEHNPRIKKPRRMISTSPVHSETVLHQDVSELALSKSISLKDNSPAKHRAESLEQRSSLKRGKEGMSASGNFGLKSMRCCTPHVSASMEKSEAYVGEPGRTNKCLSVADVESDAETQVPSTSLVGILSYSPL